jgi:hypothetical protein
VSSRPAWATQQDNVSKHIRKGPGVVFTSIIPESQEAGGGGLESGASPGKDPM